MALLSNTGIRAGASQPVVDVVPAIKSIRLNNSDASYFKRTTGSGNRKTWSFSCWVKRVGLGGYDYLFAQGPDGGTSGNWFLAGWQTDDTFWIGQQTGGGYNLQYQTNKRFRDPHAWYHILIAVDTTQSTASNRLRLYINGTEETSFSTETDPSEDADTWVGATSTCPVMYVGRQPDGHSLDGYISNVQFVDGVQLTPSNVTETDSTTGQLVAKTYSGSYGTNGFWLKFEDTSGNTAATIGVDSSGNDNNYTPLNLQAGVRGGLTAVSEADGGLPFYNTTDTYGATKGSGYRTDSSAGTTGGSGLVLAIPGDVLTDEHDHVNTGGTALTVTTHGNVTTSSTQKKFYGTSAKFDGSGDALTFTLTGGTGSGDFTIEYWAYHDSLNDYITHFQNTRSATGFNVGTDGSGDFVWADSVGGLTRKIEVGGVISAGKWNHWAWVRSGTTLTGYLDGIAKATYTTSTNYSDTSFCIGGLGTGSENLTGYLQDIRVYKGTAKYTSNFNPVRSTYDGLIAANSDCLMDSPVNGDSADNTGAGGEVTGNYAIFSPLLNGGTLSQGGLNATSGVNKRITSNFAFPSGKWYWEVTLTSSTVQQFGLGSIATANTTSGSPPGDNGHNSYIALTNGQYYHNGSMTGSGLATTTTNDVLGFAFDADSRKFWISKNGSWQGSGSPNPATGTDPLWTVSADYAPYSPVVGAGGADAVNCALNAGQRAFADSAPSGFKCLCTNNLAEPAILKPNLHFGIDLYTGTGSSRSITSFDFDPDFVWIKKRNATEHHIAFDQVRGTEESIWPSCNYQEDSWSGEGISAWLSNGWTIGDSNNANENNDTYATWNWEADTTASGTWGANSKAYSRRANSTAGFSIIKWVGDASTGIPGTGAIPHGLSGAPDLLIQKRLDAAGDWWVGFNCIDGSFDYMRLNEQTAKGDEGYDLWDADEISNWGAGNNHDFIAYVFKNIPGFSKVGYYVGNSSADGTQVILDFRPRFLIIKSLDLAYDWHLIDTARNPFNGTSSLRLKPNSNAQEVTGSHNVVDLNCNGFKLRHSDNNWNSGHKFLYWAIADSPFKYARAG